jgi:hypothetical protein
METPTANKKNQTSREGTGTWKERTQFDEASQGIDRATDSFNPRQTSEAESLTKKISEELKTKIARANPNRNLKNLGS